MNVDWNLLLLLAAVLMCPLMHLWMTKKHQHCMLRKKAAKDGTVTRRP